MSTTLAPPVAPQDAPPRSEPEALIQEARDRARRRRRIGFALGLLLLAVAGGIGFGADRLLRDGNGAAQCPVDGCFAANGETFSTGERGPVYALSRVFAGQALSRLDPQTLQPVGRTLRLPARARRVAFSPNGRELLLSVNRSFPYIDAYALRHHTPVQLLLVDLQTMQIESAASRRLSARLGLAVAWPRPDEIVVQTYPATSMAIDPHSGVLRWKRRPVVGGGEVAADGTLVRVIHRGPGPDTAVVQTLSPSGAVHVSRAVPLPAISEGHREASLVLTSGQSGAHGYLLTRGGRVYTIDLATARLTQHDVAAPSNAPSSPSASRTTHAEPLGNRIAVSNYFPGPGGEPRAGLYLIDPTTWTARLLDDSQPSWFTTGTALVTYSHPYDLAPHAQAWPSTDGTGVTVYDSTGARRHHLFGTQAFVGIVLTPEFQLGNLPAPPRSLPVRCSSYVGTSCSTGSIARFRAIAAADRINQVIYDPISGKILGRRTERGFRVLIGPHLGFARG